MKRSQVALERHLWLLVAIRLFVCAGPLVGWLAGATDQAAGASQQRDVVAEEVRAALTNLTQVACDCLASKLS